MSNQVSQNNGSSDEFYNHELFRRDNLNYSFILESRLNINKVNFVGLKRKDKEKRVDFAYFYMPYQKFIAVLDTLEKYYFAKKAFTGKYVSGEDGGRNLYIRVQQRDNKRENKKEWVVGFQFYDNLVKKDHPNYTGQVSFQLTELQDIIEFFNLRESIRSWELVNVNKILSTDIKKRAKQNKQAKENNENK